MILERTGTEIYLCIRSPAILADTDRGLQPQRATWQWKETGSAYRGCMCPVNHRKVALGRQPDLSKTWEQAEGPCFHDDAVEGCLLAGVW